MNITELEKYENSVTYESFVYRWTNRNNGKMYIGKHKGSPDDGYISSGRRFLDVYNSDPDSFYREILELGDDHWIIQREQQLIQEHIARYGYENVYNLTTWEYLKSWKRTCLHCGKIVDPRNEEWVKSFENYHFENCDKNPSNTLVFIPQPPKPDKQPKVIKKPKSATRPKAIKQQKSATRPKVIKQPKTPTLRQINKKINELLDLQQISSTKERGDEIRQLRKLKSNLTQ